MKYNIISGPKIRPMPKAEYDKIMANRDSKPQDILGAYKLGNTKILINGSPRPKQRSKYGQRLIEIGEVLGYSLYGQPIEINRRNFKLIRSV